MYIYIDLCHKKCIVFKLCLAMQMLFIVVNPWFQLVMPINTDRLNYIAPLGNDALSIENDYFK